MGALAAFLLLCWCADAAALNLYDSEQDIEIGRAAAADVERELPMLDEPRSEQFVRELGARLAAQAPGPGFPYSFRVVNSSELNAFALPGGPIYLNRGVLEAAETEGEVAGVLAHEIAHVALRHGTEQLSKGSVAQLGLGLLGGLLGSRADSDLFRIAGGLGLGFLSLKYSRDDERQADEVGARLLLGAGYNPADLIAFFERLDQPSGGRLPAFLSSHPDPGARRERLRDQARMEGVALNPTPRTRRLAEVQDRLARLPPAPRAEASMGSGGSETSPGGSRPPAEQRGGGAEPPSRTLYQYRHPSGLFRIALPSNWRPEVESRTGATIAPPGGARRSGDRLDVIEGVLIGHHDATPSRSRFRDWTSHEDATEDLIRDILDASPQLSVVPGSPRRMETREGRLLRARLSGRSPTTGEPESVTLATEQLPDGHLIYLLLVTPERDLQTREALQDRIIESLRVNENRHR